jgi:hypothetical protein
MRLNSNWLNQNIIPGEVNRLDLTGYLVKGANTVLVDFPFTQGDGSFCAKIVIEYFNTDRIDVITDESWLTAEVYTMPANWSIACGSKAPEIVPSKPINYSTLTPPKTEWAVTLPDNYLSGLNNAYLYVNYTGDIGRCRLGHKLISDNFNNGTTWQIQLKNLGNQVEVETLNFEIAPLVQGYHILFDNEPKQEEIGKINLNSIKILPEYGVKIRLR